MKKSENKFTVKFTLSSQNVLPGCELVVNQNASYALIDSNMSVNLQNKGVHSRSISKPERGLFALCSLIIRSLFASKAKEQRLY